MMLGSFYDTLYLVNVARNLACLVTICKFIVISMVKYAGKEFFSMQYESLTI